MPELLLTDVDEVVIHDLRERATRHGRTPTEEAKAILKASLLGESVEVWAQVDVIYQRLATSDRTFSESSNLVREDRDR